MILVYCGPHDGVDVVLPDGSEVTVANGHYHDFADEVASSLLRQGPLYWQVKKAPVAAQAAPVKALHEEK